MAPGDRLFLNLNVSHEAHVYLVDQDEKDEGFVLFPLPEQEPKNPIPVGQHQPPGSQGGVEVFWQVLKAGVREHFLRDVRHRRAWRSWNRCWPQFRAPNPAGRSTPRLPASAVGVLRSVGGLTTAQPSPSVRTPSLSGLAPLPVEREQATGIWARDFVRESLKRLLIPS